MEKIARMDAAKLALPRYFTGVACGRGHTVERYTSSGNCVDCARKSSSAASQALKAARFGEGIVELKVQVHKDDLEGIKVHIEAIAQARRLVTGAPTGLCPHGCRSDQFCQPCDIGQEG